MALYIYCPNCDNQIPAKLQCRGRKNPAHRGYWFQTCNNCDFFRWIPPPSPEDPLFASGPSGDPYPRNETFRSPTPGSPMLDPALSNCPSDTSAAAATPPAATPSLTATDISKRNCSRPNCTRLATAKSCTHAMCKHCCRMRNAGCAYAAHRNSTPTTAANGNPAALARPPAVIPGHMSTSASSLPLDAEAPPLASKIYRKPMDDTWAAQYSAGLSTQQRRKETEDQKREDVRRVQNEVCFCYFSEDGKEPEHLRDQEVPRYPYYNLADSPALLRKMGLKCDDEVYVYNFIGRLWNRDDVSTTIRLVPGQTLLIRRLDVTVCARIDEMIALHAPTRKLGKAAGSQASKRKPDHECDPSNCVAQVVRTTQKHPREVQSHSSTRSPSPVPTTSSPFPSPSALLSLSKHQSSSSSQSIDLTASPQSRSASPGLVIKAEPSVDSANDLWKLGRVLVPAGFGSWPAGMYVRDMAWAFGKISVARGSDSDVESRFCDIFPGVPFKKPTYSRQRQFWFDSSQAERDAAFLMPRNEAGRWTTWRRSSTGMLKFKNKAKKDDY